MAADNPKPAPKDLEMELVRRDFFRSLLFNGLFLIALIVLYKLNEKMAFLDRLADKF